MHYRNTLCIEIENLHTGEIERKLHGELVNRDVADATCLLFSEYYEANSIPKIARVKD